MKLALLLGSIAIAGVAVSAPQETQAQKDARMKWWKDARFGLFLHWGTYAVPAGEWKGKDGYAEWIREEAHIPLAEYEPFAREFNPVDFNADKWVSMAKNAGMKYIVITSKHHEGFNMFASKYSDYNIMNTPFHRDPMKELAAACKKQGIKFCFYHSIMDWHHPDYLPRRGWEDRPVDGADFRRFVQYLRNEVTQLLTDYGPIGVMWFDGEWESTWNHEDGKALYELCRTLQPNVIVNNRVDVGRSGIEGVSVVSDTAGDYDTPEQTIPASGLAGYWETCMTMNDHWGYNKDDHDYKSSQDLIRKLVDIASKGGNFLLNIGPTAKGDFPPESQKRLADLGAWMKVNGKAVYGTDRTPFRSALPWGRCTLSRSSGRSIFYLDVFDWPADGKLVVPGVGNRPLSARLLSDPHKLLKVDRRDSDLVVIVPTQAPDPNCSVVALEVEGEPLIYNTPTIETPSEMIVQPVPVTIETGSPRLLARYTLDGSDPTASSPEYNGPILISSDADLRVRAFFEGKPVSPIAEQKFQRVTPQPAVTADSVLNTGLAYQFYRGDWDQVPDFGSLTPQDSGTLAVIGLEKWPQLEHFGLRVTGYIQVPDDGVYRFELSSDDGSKLNVDGKLLIDDDGAHSMTTKAASIALAKGLHSIEIGYFNKTGGLGLALKLALAGQQLKPIDPSALWH
jgi:alpha-L-fucosidase